MNVVPQYMEEWDAEDNLPIAEWLERLSAAEGLETSVEDLTSWFKGTAETEQLMTDNEICEEVEEEESFIEIMEPPTE